jgi:hypothetical protein
VRDRTGRSAALRRHGGHRIRHYAISQRRGRAGCSDSPKLSNPGNGAAAIAARIASDSRQCRRFEMRWRWRWASRCPWPSGLVRMLSPTMQVATGLIQPCLELAPTPAHATSRDPNRGAASRNRGRTASPQRQSKVISHTYVVVHTIGSRNPAIHDREGYSHLLDRCRYH